MSKSMHYLFIQIPTLFAVVEPDVESEVGFYLSQVSGGQVPQANPTSRQNSAKKVTQNSLQGPYKEPNMMIPDPPSPHTSHVSSVC